MSIIRSCDFNGCNTLTLGRFCIVHESPVAVRVFPRGRPFPDLSRGPRRAGAVHRDAGAGARASPRRSARTELSCAPARDRTTATPGALQHSV